MIGAKVYFLHLVMGEIGGVGKSWFAKLLIEAYISMKLEYLVVDTDESTPNVGMSYDPENYSLAKINEYNEKLSKANSELLPLIKSVTAARSEIASTLVSLKAAQAAHAASSLSEDSKKVEAAVKAYKEAPKKLEIVEKALEKAQKEKIPTPLQQKIHFIADRLEDRELPNEIIDWMIEQQKDAIVNLPAQVGKVINSWIQSSGLTESSMIDEGIQTICWFVGKPSLESIEQLTALRDFHGENLKIVLVKNYYKSHPGKWEDILTPSVIDSIDSMKITQIDLPDLLLSLEQRSMLDQQHLTFSDAALQFGIVAKNRTIKYLKDTTEIIKATGLLKKPEVTPPSTEGNNHG